MNLINASDVPPSDRIGPVERIVNKVKEQSDEHLRVINEVAEELGVHYDTIRRICRTDKVKAPSLAWVQGKMTIYFYTDSDVEELRNYIQGKRNR